MLILRLLTVTLLCCCAQGCGENGEHGALGESGEGVTDRSSNGAEVISTELPSLTMTPDAASEIREVGESQVLGEYWVRVGVKRAPKGGLSYILDLTQDIDQDLDYFLTSESLDVVIRKEHAVFLDGTIIRFQDDDQGRGFVFDNPNAVDQ